MPRTIEQRIERLEDFEDERSRRLLHLEQAVNGVEVELTSLGAGNKRQFELTETRFDRVAERFDRLETKVDDLRFGLDELRAKVEGLHVAIDALRKELRATVDAGFAQILAKLDAQTTSRS